MRFESYLPVWYFPETPLPHVHTFVRYINILQRIQPWALLAPLLTSLIHCHCSSRVSFHRETWRQLKCKKKRKGQSPNNLVIATTDSKDIARHRPADMPDDILKGVQDPEETNKLRIQNDCQLLLGSPGPSILLSPDDNPSVLAARGKRLPARAQTGD